MATADLKLIYSGGGELKPSFFSGQLQIGAGATGTILTITAPSGKLARLTAFISAGAAEAGISITADSVPVVTTLNLAPASGGSAVGTFVVGVGMANTSTAAGSGAAILPFVQGSQISITKASGSTASAINYSFMYGD